MPVCKCGFDFARARLDGVDMESYAAIPDDGYGDIIEDEAAIAHQRDESERLAMIAGGTKRVGTVQVCPTCGTLLLIRPQGDTDEVRFAWFRPQT